MKPLLWELSVSLEADIAKVLFATLKLAISKHRYS